MAKKFNLAALVPEMEAVSESDTPRITMIPIAELRPNGGNFYDTSNFEDLADSIELNGLLEPLCVFRRGQGTGSYVIFSGHRRYKALRLLYEKSGFEKWTEVPCIVYPDPHDANRETVMLIHANSTGRILSNWEKAEQALRLKKALVAMREGGADLPGRIRDLVAEEMQMSASKLARLEAIGNNLKFPGFADAWRDGKLGESVAYEISKLSMDKQMDVWDGMVSAGKSEQTLSIKDVEQFSADDAGAARVSDAVFNSDTGEKGALSVSGGAAAVSPEGRGESERVSKLDTNGETIPQPPAAAAPFTQGSLKWRRCFVDEPEEGQIVLLLDPDVLYMPDIVLYRDGQFIDEGGNGEALDVKSCHWWLPLPSFPLEVWQ